MRISELAEVMAPNLPHQIIGIRPGEKMHEVLLTNNDSRTVLELEDRYIVEPDFTYWKRNSHAESGAKRVNSNFNYQSDTNREWLDGETMRQIIGE